jgi:hypothetical protein
VDQFPNLAALDKLKTRIQALRAKTIDNGCTEAEALLAAARSPSYSTATTYR